MMSSLIWGKSTTRAVRSAAHKWQWLSPVSSVSSDTLQQRQQTNGVSTYRYGGDSDDEDDGQRGIALVLGSSGCLGRSVTRHLVNKLNMQVIGADVVDLPDETDTSLHHAFVQMPKSGGVADVTTALVRGLSATLSEEEEINAIICASGGWQGDPPMPKLGNDDDDEELFLESAMAYGQTIDKMMEMNLHPVLAAGYAANRFMADEGLFVVIGATAALSPTQGMLGYGLSKVGAHHFIQTLGETSGKSDTTKARRKKARQLRKNLEYLDTLSVIGILPTTIDTPSNREAMPHMDFNQWTNPDHIAKEIGTWIKTPPLRPHSGSLVKVHPDGSGGAAFNLAR